MSNRKIDKSVPPGFRASPQVSENSRSLCEQGFLPFPNLGRMNSKFLGYFIQGLGASDRFKRDFCLVLAGETFTTLFAHCLLLFIAGYDLKLLSGNWGPL